VKTRRPLAVLATTAVAGLGLTALATPASANTLVTVSQTGDYSQTNPGFSDSSITDTSFTLEQTGSGSFFILVSASISDSDSGTSCATSNANCQVNGNESREFTILDGASNAEVEWRNSNYGTSGTNSGLAFTVTSTVQPDPTPDSGSGGSGAAPATVDVTLDQITSEVLRTWASTATLGSWKQLPESSDITGVDENAGKTFLGAATTPDFPVDIAQRQVDNGWGAYEIFNEDGDLTSVFIPAGSWMHITNSTRLYAIWGD